VAEGKIVILSTDMCFSNENSQIYHAVQCNRTAQYNLNRVFKQGLGGESEFIFCSNFSSWLILGSGFKFSACFMGYHGVSWLCLHGEQVL
jgi:hypothetical protein